MRQMCPLGGHEVRGLHGAQRHHVLVGAPVAHDSYRAHWQEYRKGLRRLVVPARGAQLVDEDGIGALQEVDLGFFDRPEDAHAQARPGEWMAEYHLARQPEREAELAHLVLE